MTSALETESAENQPTVRIDQETFVLTYNIKALVSLQVT